MATAGRPKSPATWKSTRRTADMTLRNAIPTLVVTMLFASTVWAELDHAWSAGEAAGFVSETCIATAPGFTDLGTRLAEFGFVANAAAGGEAWRNGSVTVTLLRGEADCQCFVMAPAASPTLFRDDLSEELGAMRAAFPMLRDGSKLPIFVDLVGQPDSDTIGWVSAIVTVPYSCSAEASR